MKEYVVFTEKNARIMYNPNQATLNTLDPKWPILIDPDKTLVHGIPPHNWVPDIEKNRVLPKHLDKKDIVHDVGVNTIKHIESENKVSKIKLSPHIIINYGISLLSLALGLYLLFRK